MDTKAAFNTPIISTVWIRLSYLIVLLVALVGVAGVALPSVYAKEHISWATQGYGQDIVNVLLVVPSLLICLHHTRKGSLGALLIWIGLLIYLAYSYVLYAFFMHFGAWFLVYTAVLGLSFYTLVGILVDLNKKEIELLGSNSFTEWPSVYLFVNGSFFFMLWMIEIIPHLINGQVPKSAVDVGLWVNPVHVMDLAFILPGMILAAVLLHKKKYNGYLLAVPLMVFAITMGTAIVSMIIALNIRNVSAGIGPLPLMILNVAVGVYLVIKFIKNYKIARAG